VVRLVVPVGRRRLRHLPLLVAPTSRQSRTRRRPLRLPLLRRQWIPRAG
jgi:hypothetical protein